MSHSNKAFTNRWADQCPEGHDTVRNNEEFSWVGQNMADSWQGASKADKGLKDKIQGWYDEVSKYSKRSCELVQCA